MQILLREYANEKYTWKTAKYNHDDFFVDGSKIAQTNIVAIVNDNRKNYIQCSCCGQVFRKGDAKFQIHKAKALSPETCFGCKDLNVKEKYLTGKRYSINPDGTYTEALKRVVRLECAETGWFSYSDINSEAAINGCKKRQCANATEVEIMDFFTENPGVFDDIITIDALLDKGHNVPITRERTTEYEFVSSRDYSIYAVIDSLGIIDHFYVWYKGETWNVYYSKKYDALFYPYNHHYEVWDPYEIDFHEIDEIKKEIAKLYR